MKLLKLSLCLFGFGLLIAGVLSFAGQIISQGATLALSTNATTTLGATIPVHGTIVRGVVTVSTGGTGNISILDIDGTSLWSSSTGIQGSVSFTNVSLKSTAVECWTHQTNASYSTNKTVRVNLTVEQ